LAAPSHAARAAALAPMADWLAARAEAIIRLMVLETGCPPRWPARWV
jgi:acyl-CoA reductase-like NAD-dependent aldehyde dehydrogenase